jgi:hypothetical protein
MPALRAFSTVGTIALRAGGHQLLNGGDLTVIVAVELAGIGLQGDAKLLGLGLGAFLHLDEEGIGVGLGDEADDVSRVGRRGDSHGEGRNGGARQKCDCSRHRFPPITAGSAAFPASHARSAEATKGLLLANPHRAVGRIRAASEARVKDNYCGLIYC